MHAQMLVLLLPPKESVSSRVSLLSRNGTCEEPTDDRQQRNGRKSLTTVAGLPQELDFPKVLKALKKTFSVIEEARNCFYDLLERL